MALRRTLPVVRRARDEVKAGRLWKARDQLTGAIRTHHADQDVLDLLGEVYFEMGDLPAAWRYWFLTERSDERAELARTAFEDKFGGADLAATLRQFPAREPIEDYPESVQQRISKVSREAKDADVRWPRPAPVPL